MVIIMLGAPGSGKGTLAQKIQNNFMLPHISTGDILREEINSNSNLGKKFKEIIKTGNLISDDLVFEIVKKRISKKDCMNGYILDGYPRNIKQAIMLEAMAKVDVVINIEVSDKTILERLPNRMYCEKCNKIYNKLLYKKPICECGGKLIVRQDDKLEVIKQRLEVYRKETQPLLEFYKDKLIKVNGQTSPDVIYNFVEKELKKRE